MGSKDDHMSSSDGNVMARAGLAHVSPNPFTALGERVSRRSAGRITITAQPNADPHFGTMVMIFLGFAVAAGFQKEFGKPVELIFDQLENAPHRKGGAIPKRWINGEKAEFAQGIGSVIAENGAPLIEQLMMPYNELLQFASSRCGVAFQVRSYREVQSTRAFRAALVEILDRQEEFIPVLEPQRRVIGLRIPCPKCGLVEKGGRFAFVERSSEGSYKLTGRCPDHGETQAVLSVGSTDYVDTNTPIRDVARGAMLIASAKQHNEACVMVDGRDWAGRWNDSVFLTGLSLLGFGIQDVPIRFYVPTITDRFGAKLSKSLYLKNYQGDFLPEGFQGYQSFLRTFGLDGLETLWAHIDAWTRDAAYLDRDSFTVDYIDAVLRGKIGLPVII